MKKEHEEDLIARWQSGDPRAFEELVRAWQNPIARFLSHYTGDTAIVEDLCQEVFLRVYLAREKYRTTGAFSTWIYRIALNVARDQARRNSKIPRPAQQIADRVGEEGVVARALELTELQEMVAGALAELPENLRLTVVLKHFQGMSYADMARLLKIPESTLKSRFAAALSRLHAHLQQKGWNAEELTS